MEERIIYKSDRNEKVISKEELYKEKSFFKNFYINGELVRTEYISHNGNSDFTTYYLINLVLQSICFKVMILEILNNNRL